MCTAYHPQTNGMVERFNQTLQRSLVKLVNKQQDNWDEYIDGVLFAYRTSVHKSTQVSPFEMMYCRYMHVGIMWATGSSLRLWDGRRHP
jgi:transposase InsO family protein